MLFGVVLWIVIQFFSSLLQVFQFGNVGNSGDGKYSLHRNGVIAFSALALSSLRRGVYRP